jgi:hypothetical protein
MFGDAWRCLAQVLIASWNGLGERRRNSSQNSSSGLGGADALGHGSEASGQTKAMTAADSVLRCSQMFSDVLSISHFFNLLKGFCFSVLVWSWFFILLQGRPTRFGATSCGKGETFQRQNCAVDLLQAVGRVSP